MLRRAVRRLLGSLHVFRTGRPVPELVLDGIAWFLSYSDHGGSCYSDSRLAEVQGRSNALEHQENV